MYYLTQPNFSTMGSKDRMHMGTAREEETSCPDSWGLPSSEAPSPTQYSILLIISQAST